MTKKPAHGPEAQKPKPRLQPGTWGATTLHGMNDRRLRGRHWRVLHCISSHADGAGYAWPSQELVSKETGDCRRIVNEVVKQLVNWGYIIIESKERRKGRWAKITYRVVRMKLTLDPP